MDFLKKESMLMLQNLAYSHPDKEQLFQNLDLVLNRYDKAALIGNNGAGKSTLLRIMAGVLAPTEGTLRVEAVPYYVPQIFGQYNHLTVAQALMIEAKMNALQEILSGTVTEANLALLDDDWTLEARCEAALQYWKLENTSLSQSMSTLSGGQKTKVFLAGIMIHQPELVLLDEPSNHLDAESRQLLYHFIQSTSCTLLMVSHDRTLLNLLDTVYELSRHGITAYGGNYDFYAMQKGLATEALQQEVKDREKALRKAKTVERESLERQQKLDARGKKKQEKAGVPTIMMNTLRNNAEKSTARLKGVHAEKTGAMAQELHTLRQTLPDIDKMKFGFAPSALHKGKILVTATNVNFGYANHLLWKEALNFQMVSGERIVLKGANGSGKTTLIQLILGKLAPQSGVISTVEMKSVYIDQDYSLIQPELKVYEQASRFNFSALPEHEVKTRLARFLFAQADWDKPCAALSGGEKMRLMLCCLTIGQQAPDLIVLDEPTNNLDLQNIEILTAAINEYQGTLLVVSHDDYFLQEIQIGRTIYLESDSNF